MKANDILRKAADIIEERGKLRDKEDGERSMGRAVKAYTSLRGCVLDSELDGWLFLCLLKMARATAGKTHEDDLVDLVGYSALAAECVSEDYIAYEKTKEQWEKDRTEFFRELDQADQELYKLVPGPGVKQKYPESGWIEWNGGAQPVDDDTMVTVRFRDSTFCEATNPAFLFRWERGYGQAGLDVIAYRVVKE